MPVFFLYLFKLSLSLAAVYLFYRLLLQRLTFYQANRWFLLTYPLACFVIPIIDVAPLLQQAPTATVLQWVPVLHQTVSITEASGPNGWQLAGWVLAAGSLVMLMRLAIQYLSLLQIKKQASPFNSEGITIYQVNKNIMPFSFANGIYVNVQNHTPDELQEIIRHEYVHVKQRHSADILLAELLCIVNWFNPFAWLLRHAIRQNLEFIADNSVVQGGVDKKNYQYLLLKVVGDPQFRIVNQFNFSSLKKRIVMMNKIKSSRSHLLKFLLVLPLVAVLLLAFRQQFAKKPQQLINGPALVVGDTLPQPPVTAKPYTAEDAKTLKNAINDFTKRHPKVKNMQYMFKVPDNGQPASDMDHVPTLYLTLANGGTEKYRLNDDQDMALFKERYGETPPVVPPPPPPPAPAALEAPEAPAAYPSPNDIPAPAAYPTVVAPAPPAVPSDYPVPAEAPTDPVTAQAHAAMAQQKAAMEQSKASLEQSRASMEQSKASMEQSKAAWSQKDAAHQAQAAMAPPPPPAPVKLPAHIKSIRINNSKATVTLKNGTVENYNLNNEQENKAFQNKYGKLTPPPPPPPAKAKNDNAYWNMWDPSQLTKKKPNPDDGC